LISRDALNALKQPRFNLLGSPLFVVVVDDNKISQDINILNMNVLDENFSCASRVADYRWPSFAFLAN